MVQRSWRWVDKPESAGRPGLWRDVCLIGMNDTWQPSSGKPGNGHGICPITLPPIG